MTTAAERVATLARMAGTDTAVGVENLRRRVGQVHVSFRFEGENADARARMAWTRVRATATAKDKAAPRGSGVSCWRSKQEGTNIPHVTLMGEETGAPFVRRASRIVRQFGGIEADLDKNLIQALRARRWEATCEGLLEQIAQGRMTPRDMLRVAHFGNQGARLSPDGTMSPARKPQG